MRHHVCRRFESGRSQGFRPDTTAGGCGEVLDTDAGLILTNGGKTVTLDTSSAETVEDLLNLINGSGLGLAAEINATRDGINVRSRLSGADLTIGENGGQLATQLGIRTYTDRIQAGGLQSRHRRADSHGSDEERFADYGPRRHSTQHQSFHGQDSAGCDRR